MDRKQRKMLDAGWNALGNDFDWSDCKQLHYVYSGIVVFTGPGEVSVDDLRRWEHAGWRYIYL